VVAFGVLRGTADTRLPAGIALVGFWGLGLPLAYYLAFHGGFGARGLWWGLTAGLGAAAVLLMFRIRARFRAVIEVVD
jgi:MATE family multidrug resistance protein